MATFGPAGESLRLAEHYRRLTDEELIELALQKQELTEMAQQALAGEILSRRLTIPDGKASDRPAPPPDVPDTADPYAEERRLVEIRKVWSEADARRLENVLDMADIPFYIGEEKATTVDQVTSNFAEGLPVRVMQIGVPWAIAALQNYFPKDEPPEAEEEEDTEDAAIHCPRCRSTDVVFDELVDQSSEARADAQKYRWTCSSCGYEWEDEGVETKK